MHETDLQYYERRYGEELESHRCATTPEAASAHRALSLIYADEVRRLSPAPITFVAVTPASGPPLG